MNVYVFLSFIKEKTNNPEGDQKRMNLIENYIYSIDLKGFSQFRKTKTKERKKNITKKRILIE